MADNVAITAGTGTTIAADDIGGVLHQRVKLSQGADGTGVDVSSAAPLQVTLANTGANTNKLLVTADPHAVTIASGGVASGAIASGAVASGAVASGAFASGSVADGAMVTLGAKADAKSTATDTTSITLMQVAKQISASAQLISTALGSTALDLGVGTGGSRTMRVAVDTSQTEGSEYETVAASQTNQVMGATGAAGDYLSHVIVSPGTAGCGVVTVLDNATSIAAFPGGGTTALSNLIPFIVPIGITSTSGAWKITTGANVTCTAVGNFT